MHSRGLILIILASGVLVVGRDGINQGLIGRISFASYTRVASVSAEAGEAVNAPRRPGVTDVSRPRTRSAIPNPNPHITTAR
jgi:hypothetical protein